jgi:hypothetical protein
MEDAVTATDVAAGGLRGVAIGGKGIFDFVYSLVGWIVGTAPAWILAVVLIIFVVGYYHDNHHIFLSKVEHAWRTEIYPDLELWLGTLIRPIVDGLKYIIDALNFWNRFNRLVSTKGIQKQLLKKVTSGAVEFRDSIFNGLRGLLTAITNILKWLFTGLFQQHSPFYALFYSITYDFVPIVIDIGCDACQLLCNVFKLIEDLLKNSNLICALHQILNSVLQLLLEGIKFIVITLWRLLIHGDWDPYVVEIAKSGKAFMVGCAHLGRYLGHVIQSIICRFVGFINATADTSCTRTCGNNCTRACVLADDWDDCYDACSLVCENDCRGLIEDQSSATCVVQLKAIQYIGDIVGGLLVAAGNLIFQMLDKLMIMPHDFTHDFNFGMFNLGYADLEITWDALRSPYQWYEHAGFNGTNFTAIYFDLTPYARASTLYFPELLNATDTCMEPYHINKTSCLECRSILLEANADKMLCVSESFCQIGIIIDNAIGLPAEHPIFKYLFCRLIGAILRLAVSILRVATGLLFAILRGARTFNSFSEAMRYIGYEPNFVELYYDLIYAADTVGWLLPSLIGEARFYPVKVLIANPLKLVIELAYDLYILFARLANELHRLFFPDVTLPGHYYLLDFFCSNHAYCIRIKPIADLFIVRRPVLQDITLVPIIPNLYDRITNPNGQLSFFEAVCEFINFDEFLKAFGVFIELPDFCCAPYYLIRAVVELAELVLTSLLGFMSIGDYLFCKDIANGVCAPFANIINEATFVLKCPCKIFGDKNRDEGSLGLPCICETLDTAAFLVRDSARLILTIFMVIDNKNFSQVIDAWSQLVGTWPDNDNTTLRDEATFLYRLAEGLGCTLSIFLPCECTAGFVSKIPGVCPIRYRFQEFFVSIVRIVSFVLGIVTEIMRLFVGGDLANGIRGFLEYILRGSTGVFFGQESNNTTTIGIMQEVGYLISCLVGPSGCGRECSREERAGHSMCLGNVMNCGGDWIRGVIHHVVNAILYIYDIIIFLFMGGTEGTDFGDLILGFITELWLVIKDLISGLEEFLIGLVSGFVELIFGSPALGQVVETIMRVLFSILDAIIWLVNFFFGSPESALRNSPILGSLNSTAAVGQFLSQPLPPATQELINFIHLHSAELMVKFKRDTWCYKVINTLSSNLGGSISLSDEWHLRTCLSAEMVGQKIQSDYGLDIDPSIFYSPSSGVDMIRQTMLAMGEYAKMYKMGGMYYELRDVQTMPQIPSLMKERKLKDQLPSCAGKLTNDITDDDMNCMLDDIGVDNPIARNAVYMANKIFVQNTKIRGIYLDEYIKKYFTKRVAPKLQLDDLGKAFQKHLDASSNELAITKLRSFSSPIVQENNRRGFFKQGRRFAQAVGSFVFSDSKDAAPITHDQWLWFNTMRLSGKYQYKDTKNAPLIYRIARGSFSMAETVWSKAWDNLANATSKLGSIISENTKARSLTAYKFRRDLRDVIERWHYYMPEWIPKSMIPGEKFLACDERAHWCPKSNALQIYIPPPDPDSIPLLNCEIIDDIIKDLVILVNESFFYPTYYPLGQYNYNLFVRYYTNNSVWNIACPVTSALDSVVYTVMHLFGWEGYIIFKWNEWFCGVDWLTTLVNFAFETNQDAQIGPVGLMFYLRSAIPIPGFGVCPTELVSRSAIGFGVWNTINILAWPIILLTLLILANMFFTKTLTFGIIGTMPAYITAWVAIIIYLFPIIAYGYNARCIATTTGFVAGAIGVPVIALIPRGITDDIVAAIDWILNFTTIWAPPGLLEGGNYSYIDDEDAYAPYKNCAIVGFTSVSSSTKFLASALLPFIYQDIKLIPIFRQLMGTDVFDFRWHAPSEEQLACFKWLAIEPVALGLIILYVIIAIGLLIALGIVLFEAGFAPLKSLLQLAAQTQRSFYSKTAASSV